MIVGSAIVTIRILESHGGKSVRGYIKDIRTGRFPALDVRETDREGCGIHQASQPQSTLIPLTAVDEILEGWVTDEWSPR